MLHFLTTAPRIPRRAWPWRYQGTGALLKHPGLTDQCRASNGRFVHTGPKKSRPLCTSLGGFWFPGAQARRRCLFVAIQASPLAPRWPQELPALVPFPGVGSTPSYHTRSHPAEVECHVVDLRSDTVTRPSPKMRQAMAQAEVGDDDYGEDPTVNELQRVVAELLGMEEALFVPTATMPNLIAVMCHCRRRGAQVLLGKEAHIHIFEHGGIAQVAGVHSETLQDLPDGTLDLEELEHKIQQAHRSQYHPRPELICLENTHCSAGGRVLPLQYLQKVHQLAQKYGLQIHIDGARVLNAAVALGVPPSQIAQHCDSISLCLSKGVGAPAGALLAGAREFITEAWRVRKLLGGGMRQAGVLAAAALVGLNHVEETLKRDHDNARRFAQGASAIASPLCSINLAAVETNILMVRTLLPWLTPSKLCELMEAVSAEEVAATGQATSVRLFPWGKHCLRAVWHCDVSPRDTQLSGNKLRFVLDKCKQQ
nr:probable low-specificity L-threonine aldolase 2 isoform X1 [Pogona vitticeps]